MKNILIFSLAYYPLVGGAEVSIKEITDRISGKNISFDLITLRFNKKLSKFEKIGKLNVYRVGFFRPIKIAKIFFPFFALLKARGLKKKKNYNFVWAVMANYAGFAGLFFKLLNPQIKFLLTLQEGSPLSKIKRKVFFIYPLFKLIFIKADIIQAISSYLGSWAREMGFKGPLFIIPNGVDIKKFSHLYSDCELAALRKKLNFSFNDIILVTTSRLVKKNGIDVVIEALQYLPDKMKFMIIGQGSEKKCLKKLVKKLHLEDRVFFLGFVKHNYLPKYLKVADIFVRPSRSEGMGNSFIEAMASKLPVIATQEGGIADFLFDAERNPDKPATGWAVDKDNPRQIAEAVKKIIAYPKQTKKVIENAYKLIVEKYDWDQIAKRMENEIFIVF